MKGLAEILERKTRDELLELLFQVSSANEHFEDQLLQAATGITFDEDVSLQDDCTNW
jgi:hypothetical protein